MWSNYIVVRSFPRYDHFPKVRFDHLRCRHEDVDAADEDINNPSREEVMDLLKSRLRVGDIVHRSKGWDDKIGYTIALVETIRERDEDGKWMYVQSFSD